MRARSIISIIATIVLVGHMSVLGTWIVDDAGISFAYARNLATGHGLVAQPGLPPVEGFTNLLWTLLLAVPMGLGVFDPVFTPKILAVLCALAAFTLLAGMVRADGRRPWWLAGAALVATALVPGFAIWCASGLENGLYALTVACYGAACLRPAADGRRPWVAGLALFIVFIARPDGLLYFWILPLLAGVERVPWGAVGNYLAAFLAPFALLTVGRAAYFGDVLPNPFYAKDAEGSQQVSALLDAMPLPAAAPVFLVVAAGGLLLGAWLAFRAGGALARWLSAERLRCHLPLALAAGGWAAYAVLRGDWMGEHRFLTPFFLCAPAALLGIVHDVVGGRSRGTVAVVALLLVCGIGLTARQRTRAFAEDPALGLAQVRAQARRIDTQLAAFGTRAVVATPDIGGALWEDRFTVVDLAGLTDRHLGSRELRHGRAAFARHVVEEIRPDAVWLHSNWYGTTVGDEQVFFEAYAPVDPDAPPPAANLYLRREGA